MFCPGGMKSQRVCQCVCACLCFPDGGFRLLLVCPFLPSITSSLSPLHQPSAPPPQYLLSSKEDLHVGVDEVLVLTDERLLHVGHEACVHPGQSLGSVNFHVEPGPLPFWGHALGEQQVPVSTGSTSSPPWTGSETPLCLYARITVGERWRAWQADRRRDKASARLHM